MGKVENLQARRQGSSINVMDTLMNLVSGLGMNHDKNAHNQHVFIPLTRYELEAAFRGDWIARKIVYLPAYDMVREGRAWQANKNTIEAVELEEKRLKLWKHILGAMIFARLDGGSGLIIGGPGDPREPLEPSQITKGGLKYLYPVRRWHLTISELEWDLYSPWFGQPKYYELNFMRNGQRPRLHPSRVIRFQGNEIPEALNEEQGWSDSVLQVVMDAVYNAGIAQAGIASLVQEAKLDVIKVPNLMESLSTEEYTQSLIQRFTLASMAKSSQNALILDGEEEWERKQINFTQLPDVLKLYLQVCAAAADIPATRLCGLSPQGLNATGDTEERMYYDRIAGDRKAQLVPLLDALDEMIIRSAIGRSPRDVFYVWNPLWQLSAKEAADVAKLKAETVKAINDTGLIPPEALGAAQANQLIEDAQFPGFEDAYEKLPQGQQAGQGANNGTKAQTPAVGSDPGAAGTGGGGQSQTAVPPAPRAPSPAFNGSG